MFLINYRKASQPIPCTLVLSCYLGLTQCTTLSTSLALPSCIQSSATPISIPIVNITTEDGYVFSGVTMLVGTPPQALAFGIDGFVMAKFK